MAMQAFNGFSNKFLANIDVDAVVVVLLVLAEWVVSTALAMICFWNEWMAAAERRKRYTAIAAGLTVGL
ncbi:hypothetical protein MMC26_000223, partial [Xylographa opegraphella]|nr:hypothetical protein [Xylographa opegraphella]